MTLQVTVGWDNGEGGSNQAPDPDIIGYQLLVDGQPVGGVMNRSSPQATLDKLQPGKSIKAAIAPVTIHGVNAAEISSPIKVIYSYEHNNNHHQFLILAIPQYWVQINHLCCYRSFVKSIATHSVNPT